MQNWGNSSRLVDKPINTIQSTYNLFKPILSDFVKCVTILGDRHGPYWMGVPDSLNYLNAQSLVSCKVTALVFSAQKTCQLSFGILGLVVKMLLLLNANSSMTDFSAFINGVCLMPLEKQWKWQFFSVCLCVSYSPAWPKVNNKQSNILTDIIMSQVIRLAVFG